MASEKKAKPTERDEIHRLYVALFNFLTVGYDAKYQKSESAVEQLKKLRGYAIRNQRKSA